MADRIAFDRALYAEEAVREAVDAFAHLAALAVENAGTAVVVTLSDPDPRFADVLADELANHALFATARQRNHP